MAKSKKHTVVDEAPAEQPTSKGAVSRGPRGTVETAVITVLVESNPKRPGSKAHAVFEHYKNGQTIAEFADSLAAADLGKEATPNLVYDAKHGFITIEGYDPGEVIVKAAKEAKPAKPKKAKKSSVTEDDTSGVEAAVVEETM